VDWWERLGIDDFQSKIYEVRDQQVVSDVIAVKPGQQDDGEKYVAIRIRSSKEGKSTENVATSYIRPELSPEAFHNSLEGSREWFADQFALEVLGLAPPRPTYWHVAVANPEDPSRRVQGLAVCDISRSQTVISLDFCEALGVTVEDGSCKALLRILGKRFMATVLAQDIPILAVVGKDMIERAIAEDDDPVLLLESLFLDTAARAYIARRKAKAKTTLVLGSYGNEGIKRLRFIEGHLFRLGYDPVLIADYQSSPESLESKVLSFMTLSRFAIYEATFPSGGIDEFRICKDNEVITAVLHENGRMATSMQSHYGHGHNFIKFFPYEKDSLADVLREAAKWAESVVDDTEKFFAPKV